MRRLADPIPHDLEMKKMRRLADPIPHDLAIKKMRRLAGPIPHDLVIDVLTVLPAKSLMRFKCVSKLWCSTIYDPTFVKSHRSRSLTRPDGSGFLISFPNSSFSKQHFFSANLQGNSFSHEVTLSKLMYLAITQVVDALVCVFHGNRVSICNISTHEVLILPVTSINVNAANVICTTPHYYIGFDFLKDKYKLLNMCAISIRSPDDSCKKFSSFVEWEILTLGDDSWRKIDAAPFRFNTPYIFDTQSVFVDRFIFWLPCFDELSHLLVLGAFDVIDEQFHIIPVPENVPKGIKLVQFGKDLALAAVTDICRRPVNPLTLWILLDPFKHTWIERCICFPLDVFQRHCVFPAAQFHTGEVLLTPLKLSLPISVVNYDQKKENWTTIEIAEVPVPEYWLGDQPRAPVCITPYVENILPLLNHS